MTSLGSAPPKSFWIFSFQTVYLAVDESGTGRFAAPQTRFYAGQADSLWHFKNVRLTASGDGFSHFMFVAASDFFVWIERQQPSCRYEQGAVSLQMVGGRAPFNIQIGGRQTSTAGRYVQSAIWRKATTHCVSPMPTARCMRSRSCLPTKTLTCPTGIPSC